MGMHTEQHSYLNIAIDVTCEGCGQVYSELNEFDEVSGYLKSSQEKLSEKVADLAAHLEDRIGVIKCPYCGYIQSYMQDTWKLRQIACVSVLSFLVTFTLLVMVSASILTGGEETAGRMIAGTVAALLFVISIVVAVFIARRTKATLIPNKSWLELHGAPNDSRFKPTYRIIPFETFSVNGCVIALPGHPRNYHVQNASQACYYCPKCGHKGQLTKVGASNNLLLVLLFLFFVIPGLIYAMMCFQRNKGICSNCGRTLLRNMA